MHDTPPDLLTSPLSVTRRHFFGRAAAGVGGVALASLLGPTASAAPPAPGLEGVLGGTHFALKAKRIIYLFQSGGSAQLDLFDHKPLLPKNERATIARSRSFRTTPHRYVRATIVHSASGLRVQL